jgi:threonine/homoserine/homoserine lactone efflux protein
MRESLERIGRYDPVRARKRLAAGFDAQATHHIVVEGRRVGFVSGLGAATADFMYGAIAAFGLTAVAGLMVSQQVWLRLVGGIFLVYLGVRTVLAQPADKAAEAGGRGLLGAYSSTLFLTLTNPATILSFAVIFAGLGLASFDGGAGATLALVVGVFLGSAAWWLLLSGGVSLFRGRLTPAGLRWVNRIAGGIIVAFGVVALGSLLLR